MKYSGLTDEALVEQLRQLEDRNGQNALITELYNRYRDQMIAWLFVKTKDPELAEELASEAIVKLVRALRKLSDNGQNTVQHFKSWLYRLVHNVFIDHYQQKKRQGTQIYLDEEVGKPAADRLMDEGQELVQVKINFEYRHTMQELALFLLSDAQREVYLTRYYRPVSEDKRMPVKEVAKALDMTTRMVWTHLKTGKERLEKWIAKAYQVNIRLEVTEDRYERLLNLLGLQTLNENVARQHEQESIEPALRLLSKEEIESVVQRLLGKSENANSSGEAFKKLRKMLEGRRTL